MMFDKKKIASIVVSKIKPKSDEMPKAPTNEMGDEMDKDIAQTSAAEELLSAIESKDAKAVASAFRAMMELCGEKEEESEEMNSED